jgi:hypothetical protein
MNLPFTSKIVYATHQGSKRTHLHHMEASAKPVPFRQDECDWRFALQNQPASVGNTLHAELVSGIAEDVAFGVSFLDESWSKENFFPHPRRGV